MPTQKQTTKKASATPEKTARLLERLRYIAVTARDHSSDPYSQFHYGTYKERLARIERAARAAIEELIS